MSSIIKRIVGGGAIVVMCAYAVIALRGPQGLSSLLEKRKEIQFLQDRTATLRRENQMKKDRIDRLRTNPTEQELEIRRQLKLVRPGETTFILPDGGKQDAAPAASPAQ